MRPVILYSLPRTRSTAILQASRQPRKLHEPFDNYTLFGPTSPDPELDPEHWHLQVTDQQWELVRQQMDYPDSVSKFFGHSLYYLPRARPWFAQADQAGTHQIFVIVRDLREVALSYLMARYWGWTRDSERGAEDIWIHPELFRVVEGMFRVFLKFLPTNATLISWDRLPGTHFDRTQVHIQDQRSQSKLNYIRNLDQVENAIEDIIKKIQPEWQDRVMALPWADTGTYNV